MSQPTEQTSKELDSLRHDLHMKMLAMSKNAKECGEMTVVLLGHAVSVALDWHNSEMVKKVSEAEIRTMFNIPIPAPAKKTKINQKGHTVPNSFGTHRSQDYIDGYVAGSKKHFNDTKNAVNRSIKRVMEKTDNPVLQSERNKLERTG